MGFWKIDSCLSWGGRVDLRILSCVSSNLSNYITGLLMSKLRLLRLRQLPRHLLTLVCFICFVCFCSLLSLCSNLLILQRNSFIIIIIIIIIITIIMIDIKVFDYNDSCIVNHR